MEVKEHWIFYLKLQRELPREFFTLDQKFKNSKKSLVPVTIKGLTNMTDKNKSMHVLIVIKSIDEYMYFNKRVKKILKYLIKTGKVNLYIASSFNGVNDTAIMKRDLYNFIKIPVATEYLCGSISRMIDLKESSTLRWPGGVRSNFQLTG
jgi:hypothetical protein